MNEQSPANNAREALRALVPAVEQMASQHEGLTARNKALSDKVADLTRLLQEEQERGAEAQRIADEYTAKAKRLERLDETSHKLVAALDRLPTSMNDATLVAGSRPPIPLYGTWEWAAVVEAKFYVQEQLRETRSVG